ncbi:bcl-2-related protein A1-like [Hemicordylus capensis]|uniref:bcl-2-related protein A1-like n=1 Tax=Hemicordylus capensis TaxID=884348 RepID=UPI0023049C59|nr:bcl-2-related protein A1-like [Hemicordylus capensis]XP_053142961.1 bcl-2-related protein A1-like [Hemicordylus capensis]
MEYRHVYSLAVGCIRQACGKPEAVGIGPLLLKMEAELRPHMDSLHPNSLLDIENYFTSVMAAEFADGKINKGRFLTIFLFGGLLTKSLTKRLCPAVSQQIMDKMALFITDYIVRSGWHEHVCWESCFAENRNCPWNTRFLQMLRRTSKMLYIILPV